MQVNGVLPCVGKAVDAIKSAAATGIPAARGGKSGGGSSGKGGRGDRGRGRGRDGNDGDDGDDGEGERCSGVMVLDSTSKPLWKLCCNVCPLVIRLNGDLHDVKTLPGECCGECGATKLQVVFHRDKSPLPEGDDRYTGCLLCDGALFLSHIRMRCRSDLCIYAADLTAPAFLSRSCLPACMQTCSTPSAS